MAVIARLPRSRRPRRKPRRLRRVSILPSLLTLGNLLCGFSATYFGLRAVYDFGGGFGEGPTVRGISLELMLPSFLSVGAGLMLLGMLFDMFDGLVARMTRSTTDFGGQLDSLADLVTCGVAPAILMLAFMTQQLAGEGFMPSPISAHPLGRAAWVCAAVYVATTAIRLARFNVEHAKAGFDHRIFRGLPSPGAGCVMATMLIFQDQMGSFAQQIMVYALPPTALALGLLMVSRIPYKRSYRAYMVGKKPFSRVVVLLVIFAVFWVYKTPMLLAMTWWYVLSGPADLLLRYLRQTPRSEAAAAGEDHREIQQPQAKNG